MIVCRNVVIYFTEEAKDEICRSSMILWQKMECYLSESTEQIMNYRELNLKRHQSFFFQKMYNYIQDLVSKLGKRLFLQEIAFL